MEEKGHALLSERFKDHFPYEPTKCQSKAMERIARFLALSSAGDSYVLKGYAGTGKTTLIAVLVDVLKKEGLSSVLLAPTGRAAKVVSSYALQPAFTIHRRIYRTRIKDGVYAGFSLNPNKSKNTLFIVDEASMISEGTTSLNFKGNNLLEDLITFVKSGENCKLIFVGDSAQLPPVGESKSPALDARRLMEKYSVRTGTFELTEVVRQSSETGILFNATQIRDHIRNDQSCPKLDLNFDDFKKVEAFDLPEILMDSYRSNGPDEVIVVCRSNLTALNYNKQIRYQGLYFDDELSVGDRLMCVKNNYFWLEQQSSLGFIANGDTMIVIAVRSIKKRFGFRFADLTLQIADQPNQPSFDAVIILDSLYSKGPSLAVEDFKKLYQEIVNSSENDLTASEKKKLYSSNVYLNALQVKFAYAVTCHKAQGGQWKTVLIDRGFISSEDHEKVDYQRWLYTAITRATEEVYLIGFSDSELKSSI